MKLSILIPTVKERHMQFEILRAYLQNMIDLNELENDVEIIHICDDKQMSIGEKREWLYANASGDYSWQVDDDDHISPNAIQSILKAMEDDPDCITFQEYCNIDGVISSSNFSLKYSEWGENQDGWDHVRTPFFKTPIKTSICKAVRVPYIRFGEDHLWAQAIKPLLKTEVHIPQFLYFYIHVSSPFNERYGIK